MGAGMSNLKGSLLRQTQDFAKSMSLTFGLLGKLEDAKRLRGDFEKFHGFSLTFIQFEALLAFKPSKAVSPQEIFQVLDSNKDGRIDGLQFLGGLILCVQGTFEEKARFAFELYDFNLNGSLGPIELALMMESTYSGMVALIGMDHSVIPSKSVIFQLTDNAFSHFDKDGSNALTYEEFISWARTSREIMACISQFQQSSEACIATEADKETVIEISDDEDSDFEFEGKYPEYIATSKEKNRNKPQCHIEVQEKWMIEPSSINLFKETAINQSQADANIRLDWINGFRCHDTRNVICYASTGEVVYISAKFGVVYNKKYHQQRFYQGHSEELLSLAMHPDGNIVATGQIGKQPEIHIWEITSLNCLSILTGFHQLGVSHMSFAKTNSFIMSVGMDRNHRLAIWDWSKEIVVASSIGHTSKVLGCCISSDGLESVLCGFKFIIFYNMQGRILKTSNPLYGNNGKVQIFTCISYFGENNLIVGTGNGQLYQFLGKNLVKCVQAHSLNEPVTTIFVSEKRLFSGGKDGIVHMWDNELNTIGNEINIGILDVELVGCNPNPNEKLPKNVFNANTILNSKIVSVHAKDKHVVVGTRGSEILEIDEESSTIRKFVDGHSTNKSRGLACSPTKPEYVTCGEDKSVRVWSVRKRMLIRLMKIQSEGICASYSSLGSEIGIGCADGSIYLTNSSLKVVHFHFSHTNQPIEVTKFSPNNKIFAVGAGNGVIYLYNIRRKENKKLLLSHKSVLQGHGSAIFSFDFSIDSKYIQSTEQLHKVLYYWDVQTASIVSEMKHIRDCTWDTYTTSLGWAAHGVPANYVTELSSISCSSNKKVLVTAYQTGDLGIWRFPCLKFENPLEKRIRFHTIGGSQVCFVVNDSILISIGKYDASIAQWRVNWQEDEEQPIPSTDKFSKELREIDPNFIEEYSNPDGDEGMLTKSCDEFIFSPTDFVLSDNSRDATDVDISLEWCHGLNTLSCRNMLFCNSIGEVIYSAAGVGIVYNHTTRTQRFHQFHSHEITSLAIHPSGKHVATGSSGNSPHLAIWNTDNMETESVVSGCHCSRIIQLQFGGLKGEILVSISADKDHTIFFHDWKKKILLASSKNNSNTVLALCGIFEKDNFASCGINHIHFWRICGRNLELEKGIFGRHAKIQPLVSISQIKTNNISEVDHIITGCADGSIVLWEGSHASTTISTAHRGPVNSLFSNNDIILSGGLDGQILIWKSNIIPGKSPVLNNIHCISIVTETPKLPTEKLAASKRGLTSICYIDGCIFAATLKNELLEINYDITDESTKTAADKTASSPERIICHVSGHNSNIILSMVCHPEKPLCITCGQDKTIRYWSFCSNFSVQESKDLRKMEIDLEHHPYSLAFSQKPINQVYHLAVGFQRNLIQILNDITLEKLEEIHIDSEGKNNIRVDVLQYSVCNKLLGAACDNLTIVLYQINDIGAYSKSFVCEGHIGRIKSIDFSYDSSWIQTSSHDNELFFWDTSTGERVASGSSLRDVEWATWNSPIGWPILGLYDNGNYGQTINSVDRVHGKWIEVNDKMKWTSGAPVFAVGDDFGNVSLYRYPCPPVKIVDKNGTEKRSVKKNYFGHGGHVLNVSFSYNDDYLVSTGGKNGCIFVWKTDYLEEAADGERNAKLNTIESNRSKAVSKETIESEEYNVFTKYDEGGDEFLAVKPWLGSIREPSNWKAKPELADIPIQSLELEFVYGYRGFDTRNNVYYADDAWEFVYHTAATGIVFNSKDNSQIFNLDHTDDIISLAIHPEGHTVVTGEMGKKPKIVIWDANSGGTLRILEGFHRRGVSLLSFCEEGKLIASVGLDNDHSIAIYKTDGSKLASSKNSQQKVLGIAFKDKQLVTVGVKHIQFWTLNKSNLTAKKGIFGKKGDSTTTLLDVVYLDNDVVTGQSDGTIYLWKGRNCVMSKKGHEGPVFALHPIRYGFNGILSGGKDGKILVWNENLEIKNSIDLTKADPPSSQPSIRSICYHKSSKILIGTQGCEIYEIKMTSILDEKSKKDFTQHIQGHFKGELWGLDAHPTKKEFITAGDDGSFRIWDAPNKKILFSCSIEKEKIRAVAFSPDGTHVAFGMLDGDLYVYSYENESGKCVANVKCSKKWIQVLKYSPDGKTLAVGCHDQKIYFFRSPAYTKRAVLKGHSSYITHMDFSFDSKFLQTNCGAYELLFWDVNSAKQITSAVSLRDVKWSTWTCTLGWPAQGIWPQSADGTDINSVCRNNTKNSIVTTDDSGKVKLFNYPCTNVGAKFKEYCGHASHVTNCCFIKGDDYVLTTGGLEKSIFQFKYMS